MGWEATGLIQDTDGTHWRPSPTLQTAQSKFPPLSPSVVTVATPSRASPHIFHSSTTVCLSTCSGSASARHPSDPENALGYVNYGRLIVLINRGDYFQVGYIIAKGTFPQIQQEGLAAFHQSIERIVPFLAGRTAEIDSWDKVKLLTVQVNRLQRVVFPRPPLHRRRRPCHVARRWHRHQHRPAGRSRHRQHAHRIPTLRLRHRARSRSVQNYREAAVRNTQRFQVFAHGLLTHVLRSPGPFTPPLPFRIITGLPGFRYLTARFIGMGLQPQHIKTPLKPLIQTLDSSSQSPESPAPIPAHSRFPSPAPTAFHPSPASPTHRAARIRKICA